MVRLGRPQYFMRPFDGVALGVVSGIGVQQRAMRCGIEQTAFVMLTVNLDQAFAQPAQEAGGARPVIGKSAAPPIPAELAAQDQFAVLFDPLLVEQSERRMTF